MINERTVLVMELKPFIANDPGVLRKELTEYRKVTATKGVENFKESNKAKSFKVWKLPHV